MNKKKIELEVLYVTCSQERAGAYAMILGEVNGKRQLPIIIGTAEAQAIMLEIKGIEPSRPLTHSLFSSVLQALGISMIQAVIHHVENGIFYAYIYLKSTNAILRVDSRTSDAVALAMRMTAPIYTYEDILATESFTEDTCRQTTEENRTRTLMDEDLDTLNAAMEKAIETGNYEYAAQIRDEIKKRKAT